MTNPDFAGLRLAAEEAVRQPDFDTVASRSGQLRRRRRTTVAALALAVTLAGTAVYVTVLDRPQSTNPPVATQPPVSQPQPTHLLQVTMVYAADAAHLYVSGRGCQDGCWALNASEDGGLTWHGRVLPQGNIGFFTVLGPRLLLARENPQVLIGTPSPVSRRLVSVDGGLTWRTLVTATQPVEAVAPGHQALCLDQQQEMCGPIHAVDPATGQVAPLANQPPIAVHAVWTVPAEAGLWVNGFDPDTDHPAVSWSRDGGRTWQSRTFAEAPPGSVPQIATADGRMVYVMVGDETDTAIIYRTTDGGATWTITQQGEKVPSYLGYVTADGAHVLLEQAPVARFVASRNGGRYEPVHLAGLPSPGSVPRATDGGGYLTRLDDAIYFSDDGWTWRRIALP